MALSFRNSIAANGGSATVTSLTPTLPSGWAAGDLVYFEISLGATATATGVNTPTGWTVRSDTNSSVLCTVLAYRTMQAGDAAPAFTWTNTCKWAYVGVAIQPAAGTTAQHLGFATLAQATAASAVTPNAYAAGANTGFSLLLTGCRGGNNAATAVTVAPPTNWTEPGSNADTSTATGTTSATRQVSAEFCYRTGQTGTITPGSETIGGQTSFANAYHAFAIEVPLVGSLVDDFAVQDDVKWSGFDGSLCTIASGQLQVVVSTYPGILSNLWYNLTGSSAMLRLAQAPNVGNGTTEFLFQLYIDGSNNIQFDVTNGQTVAQTKVGGSTSTLASAAYSSTDHQWLMISESGGTVSWLTSSDGITWTSFATWTATISVMQLGLYIGAGFYGTEPSPGTVLVDNFNVIPITPRAVYTLPSLAATQRSVW